MLIKITETINGIEKRITTKNHETKNNFFKKIKIDTPLARWTK